MLGSALLQQATTKKKKDTSLQTMQDQMILTEPITSTSFFSP